jgi:UDP:flavonoid glycosyltransferase YjiC (YdhE family)
VAVPDAVQHFLNAGPPPVVFSFGSAMRIARPYLQAAAEACEDLGVRGILLAKDGPQVPPNLPKNVLQADYAPFSKVFPRAACIVHHGGIGTTAQALRAGVRQVIMPLAFDQHDNAARIQALGAGKTLLPKRFTRQNVAKLLSAWLADPAPVKPCRELAAKVTAEDPLPGICREIEALIGHDVPPEKRS